MCTKIPLDTCDALLGRYQLLVLKMLGLQKLKQRVAEQIGVLTVIEAEAHFVKVGLQMFRADAMPRSNNPALQQRKGRLYAVRVHVAVYVDAILGGPTVSACRCKVCREPRVNITRACIGGQRIPHPSTQPRMPGLSLPLAAPPAQLSCR